MTIIYRRNKIIELCTGKSVLHLGFIQHANLYEEKILQNDWLHQEIANVASKLVGIDYLDNDVSEIRHKYGYECYAGDVMRLDKLHYHETFDVIVCGELIEHIQNPGLMLDGVKRFMRSDSILIITTPNPWSKSILREIKLRDESQWLNSEHICWFSFQTLKQLLTRKGFFEVFYGFYYREKNGQHSFIRNTFRNWCAKRLSKINYSGLFFVTRL